MSSVMLFILIVSGLFTLSQCELRCQRGWSQFRSRCFRIFTTPTTWNDAEQNCVTIQAHLASVHNNEEYTFLRALVFNATNANAKTWLGAADIQEGLWKWMDGSAFDYANWAGRQPDNGVNDEDCLEINYSVLWNDANCMLLRPSACAKAPSPVKFISVFHLKILSGIGSSIEDVIHQVKQRLIDHGMLGHAELRLKKITRIQN